MVALLGPVLKSVCVLLSLSFPIHYHFNKDVLPMIGQLPVIDQPPIVDQLPTSSTAPPLVKEEIYYPVPEEEFVAHYYYLSSWAPVILSLLPASLGVKFTPRIEDFCDELETRFSGAIEQIDLTEIVVTKSSFASIFWWLCDEIYIFFSTDVFEFLESQHATLLHYVTHGYTAHICLVLTWFIIFQYTMSKLLLRVARDQFGQSIGSGNKANLGGTQHLTQLASSDSKAIGELSPRKNRCMEKTPPVTCLELETDISNDGIAKCSSWGLTPSSFHEENNNSDNEQDISLNTVYHVDSLKIARAPKRSHPKRVRSHSNGIKDSSFKDDGILCEFITSTPREAPRDASFESMRVHIGSGPLDDIESIHDKSASNSTDSIYLSEEEPGAPLSTSRPFEIVPDNNVELSEFEPSPKKLKKFLHDKRDEVNHYGISPELFIDDDEKVDSLLLSQFNTTLKMTIPVMRDRIRRRSYIVAPRRAAIWNCPRMPL